MTTAPSPWRSLPYGAHVDAILTAADQMTPTEWDTAPIISAQSACARAAFDALDALHTDSPERHDIAVDAMIALLRKPTSDGVPVYRCYSVSYAVVVLCAAHLIGRRGLTVEAVREACAPAASVPALAALVGAALDDIAARTSRAAS